MSATRLLQKIAAQTEFDETVPEAEKNKKRHLIRNPYVKGANRVSVVGSVTTDYHSQ